MDGTNVCSNVTGGKAVKKTAGKLIFGDYSALYDEFGVLGSAISIPRITDYYHKFYRP
jgi:hypothetical protein